MTRSLANLTALVAVSASLLLVGSAGASEAPAPVPPPPPPAVPVPTTPSQPSVTAACTKAKKKVERLTRQRAAAQSEQKTKAVQTLTKALNQAKQERSKKC